MILIQPKESVEKFGAQSEAQFSIKASAQAFKILSDSLYSNKVQAVVRELSCNAYDSQIEAGVKTPFEVHCPNILEPYFSVKDYGTGISHEFMMNGYTTVFHSTKNQSNDTIGGLGLGRLSAFAYTDSYNIVSIDSGIRRCYVAYKESGFPSVTLMSETGTSERNGFEVNIPVEKSDFHSFQSEILKFFTLVHVPYKILGTTQKVNKPEIILNGTGWSKYRGSYTTQSYARMGLVNYPLGSNWSISAAESSILQSCVIIDFPIGSLEVTPSREALSYTKVTIEKIRERIAEVAAEVKVNLNQKIKDAKNLWDAKLIHYDIQHGEYGSFRDLVSNLEYNGVKLHRNIRVADQVEEVITRHARRSHNVRLNISQTNDIVVSYKAKVYLSNGEEKYRRKHLLAALQSADVLYVFTNVPEADVIKLTGQEGVTLPKLEDVPIVIEPRQYMGRTKSETAGKRVLLYNHISKKLECCENLTLDKAQLYVTLENKSFDGGDAYAIDCKIDTLHRLKIDISDLVIYAVRPSALKKVTHWLPFKEYYEISLKTYFDEQLIKKLESVEAVDSSVTSTLEHLDDLLRNHPKKPPVIDDLQSKIESNRKAAEDLEYILSLAYDRGISVKPQTSIQTSFSEFLSQYPMLKIVLGDSHSFKHYAKEIKDYILKP